MWLNFTIYDVNHSVYSTGFWKSAICRIKLKLSFSLEWKLTLRPKMC